MTVSESAAKSAMAFVTGEGVSAQARRFLLVGMLNTAFGYAMFSTATLLGAHSLTALLIANGAGVLFNFQTSRRLVFRREGSGRALRFVMLYALLLLMNWAALRGLERLGAPALAAQAMLVLPFAALTFMGQRGFVFRRAQDRTPSPALRPLGTVKLLGQAIKPDVATPLRLMALVLAVGNAIFLIGMLASPWIAGLACALMALSIWMVFGAPVARRADPEHGVAGLWVLALALALALCLLGGEGRIFYANSDWQIRDAVLADLSRYAWPVTYVAPTGAQVMRAPLGMYMLPSLVGRALGWRAAAPALLVQNTVLLAAILAAFMSSARRGWERAVIAGVFVAFSGLDLIGEFLVGHFAGPPNWAPMFPSLEPWSSGLQYSALVTDLFWAPNHALPALAMAAAYLAWRRGQASSLALGALAGLCVLWSPLAVMGAAPFAVFAALNDIQSRRVDWLAPARLAPLVAGLLPVAAYLTLRGGAVEHGFNLGRRAFRWYDLFLFLEVAPLVYLASRALSPGDRAGRFDLGLCAVMLVLLPLYYIGGSNDFMMRASIFPIALLAMMTARGVIGDLAAKRRRLLLPLTILAIGAATPAFEIIRAVVQPLNPPQPTDLFTAWQAPASRGTSKATYVVQQSDFERRAWLFRSGSRPSHTEIGS